MSVWNPCPALICLLPQLCTSFLVPLLKQLSLDSSSRRTSRVHRLPPSEPLCWEASLHLSTPLPRISPLTPLSPSFPCLSLGFDFVCADNLLPTPPSVDPVILTAMAPRAFFPSLPALVSAGFAAISAAKAAAQAPRKERDRGADSASASQARAVAQQQLNQLVQVQAQLVSGLRLLVAALVSSPAGLQVMQTNRADIAGLAYALDPQAEADPQSEAGIAPDPNSAFSRSPAGLAAVAAAAAASAAAAAKPLPALHGGERKPQLAPALAAQPKPAAELAAVLRQALASLEAVTILDAGPAPGTPQSQAAVNTLAAAVAGGHGCEGARIAALRSLTLSRGALPTLLRLMRERGRVHRAAVTSSADGGGMHDGQAQFGMMGQASMGLDDLDWDNDYSFAGLPRPSAVKYAPESLYADTIVLEVRSPQLLLMMSVRGAILCSPL